MVQPSSSIIFRGTSVLVGKFRCPSGHELWRTENCSGCLPTIVFPRVAVGIYQVDRSPVVATPNHVIYYNANHVYRRNLIDPRGDECEYYCVPGPLLEEVARSTGVPVSGSPDAPFNYSHAPCPAETYMKQRALFQWLQTSEPLDPMLVEEQFLGLLPRLLLSTSKFYSAFVRTNRKPCPFQREQVRAAKQYIARHFCEPLKLESIARAADCSVYHLCRIFKKFSGITIHHFLSQCRLRHSIERLLETNRSLMDIALDLGFSSHSHYTNAFRKTFGISPGKLRKTRAVSLLGQPGISSIR